MHLSILLGLGVALPALSKPVGCPPNAPNLNSLIRDEIAKLQDENAPQAPTCDLSKVKIPQAPEPLPVIPEGQKLLGVTIGRGTQNYTCESPGASTKPKAVGALATLFNASCIASDYPYLLSLMPKIALQLTDAASLTQAPGLPEVAIAGHHFFDAAGIPTFDMANLGPALVQKEAGVDAPETAMKGTGTILNGAVGWLQLISTPESQGQAKTVYRVNTAGGKPPSDCSGQDKDIAIDYAAEYWFYG